MFLQLVPALMPKIHVPAQHISQTLLLHYNPSKHLSKVEVENVLKGMRRRGAGFVHKQKGKITIAITKGENNDC